MEYQKWFMGANVGRAVFPNDSALAKIGESSIITRGDKMFYELEMHVGKDEHDVEISPTGTVLSDTLAKPEAPDPAEKKD